MWLCLTAALVVTALPSERSLTFAQALELADRQAPDLASERLAAKVSAAAVASAAAIPNPIANFRTGRGDPATTATLELPLPFLGQHQSTVAAAIAESDAAQAKLRWTREKTRAAVRRAYFSLAEAQAQHLLSLRLTALAEDLARVARQQFEVGSAPRLDAEQAALAAQRSARDAADREGAVITTRAALAVLLGLDSDVDLRASEPLEIHLPSPTVLDAVAAAHPEATFAARTRRASETRVHEARMARIPVPTAGLDLEGHLAPTVGASAVRGGLTVEVPLFLWWNGGALRQAELTSQQRELERRAVVHRLRVGLEAARRQFAIARERAAFFMNTLVPQARRVEELARIAHAVGKTPLLNVLKAQQDLAQDESDALKAILQAQVALADLEEAAGVGP